MTLARLWSVVALLMCASMPVSAHVFVQPYTLPVPFWMYLYACAAALVLSFAVVAYVMGQPTSERVGPSPRAWSLLPDNRLAQSVWHAARLVGRTGALVCLLLTVVSGFVGTSDPRANINLTLFWVAFLLGWTYLVALVGDLYALVNPWRSLVDLIEKAGVNLSRARVQYPTGAGAWPAFAWYVALVWMELFTLPRPYDLSLALTVYTVATLAGVLVFGKHAWLTHGELFSVFFRVVALVAPVEYREEGGRWQARLHAPFTRLSSPSYQTSPSYPTHPTFPDHPPPPMHPALVLFVLFMLSSTTYDAVHQTFLWVSLYWQRLLPLVKPLWGGDVLAAQAALTVGYRVYQWLGLILSPLLYLLVYGLVLMGARLLTRSTVPLWRLAGEFAPSLVPIALVYHATHYATILIADLPRMWPLAADPFGMGWQLFRAELAPPRPLNMGVIWHSQVALVLLGHVAGVLLAHKTAVRVFASARLGFVSQLPMLLLMVAYTCLGLWVLSLPLDVPQVLPLE